MTYRVEQKFDSRIPSSPGNGTPFTLFACHDTEGGTGRAGALGTIQYLIDRRDRNASYHEIWWYHEDTDEFGVIETVPASRAAHSVNPFPPKYSPTDWVKESLGRNAGDPNQGIYAVSIAGTVADVDRYAKNPKFLAHAHRRFKELQARLKVNRRAEHFQFNPSSRSDWGKTLMNALGGLTIPDELPEAIPMWVNSIKPLAEPFRATVGEGVNIRTAPDLSAGSIDFNTGTKTSNALGVVAHEVAGQSYAGSTRWYVYALGAGGLRVVHSSQIKTKEPLAAGNTAELEATIQQQGDTIANLKTQVGTLKPKADLFDQLRTLLKKVVA